MSAVLSGPVRRAHAEGGAAAVRCLALAARGPIVEAAAQGYDVTFVFADRRGEVSAAGVVCPAVPDGYRQLDPLGEATFAGTFRLPAAARVRYHFCPDPPAGLALHRLKRSPTARRIDYFNPAVDQVYIRSLRMRMLSSLLVLPGAPMPPAPPERGQPRGTVRELQFSAESFGSGLRCELYLPPGHDTARPAPVVLLFEVNDEWGGSQVFDCLGPVGAFVGVLLGGGRSYSAWLRELGSGVALSRFVADELLPRVAQHAALTDGGHLAAGFSAAALGAATLCAVQPGFPRLAAISGGWHLGAGMNVPGTTGPARFAERYAGRPRCAYLAAGRYEEPAILDGTRTLAAALIARGTRVRADTGFTDHDAGAARAYLRDGLRWLLNDGR